MQFLVDEEYNGELLRGFLKKRVGVSGALLARLKNNEHGILQNGKRVTVRALLHAGDVIELAIEDEMTNEKVLPEDIPLEIVLETPALAVLNKPPFLPTHPSSGHYTGTLANALVFHYGSAFHARFINRLDRNTSGLVLVAKDPLAASALSHNMARGEIRKTYLAIVAGRLDRPGRIETDIRRCPGSIMLREACPRGEGDHALTEYQPIYFDAEYTLLRLVPHTGRTHQLRVHLASIGHPIMGDDLYGCASPLIARQALHAAVLRFRGPGGEELMARAPMPEDMCALLRLKGWEVPGLA